MNGPFVDLLGGVLAGQAFGTASLQRLTAGFGSTTLCRRRLDEAKPTPQQAG
jgi:hypothetical protein